MEYFCLLINILPAPIHKIKKWPQTYKLWLRPVMKRTYIGYQNNVLSQFQFEAVLIYIGFFFYMFIEYSMLKFVKAFILPNDCAEYIRNQEFLNDTLFVFIIRHEKGIRLKY